MPSKDNREAKMLCSVRAYLPLGCSWGLVARNQMGLLGEGPATGFPPVVRISRSLWLKKLFTLYCLKSSLLCCLRTKAASSRRCLACRDHAAEHTLLTPVTTHIWIPDPRGMVITKPSLDCCFVYPFFICDNSVCLVYTLCFVVYNYIITWGAGGG